MLSRPTVSGSRARANGRDEIRQNAEMPADAIALGASGGGSICVTGSNRPLRSPGRDSLDADRVGAVPEQRALCADEAPRAFP